MREIRLAVTTVLLLASGAVAGAQMPARGGNMTVGRSPGRDDPAMKEMAPGLELRLANGINIIIAHARDLSLTSEQMARVVVIKRRLDSLNTPLMRELDSLQHATRDRKELPVSRGDLPERSNPAIDETLGTLRTNLRNAEVDAYEVLSGTQLQRALALVKEARTNAAITVGRDKPRN